MMRASKILLILLAAVAGCSEGSVPPEQQQPAYDSSLAKSTLIQVLETWKKGGPRKPGKRPTGIRFEDDDQAAGMKLTDYALEEPDAVIKLHEDVTVILSLRDAQGQAIRREAHYQVATNPAPAVLRSDR